MAIQGNSGFLSKVNTLRQATQAKGGYALSITSQANFSWLLGGRGFIGTASVAACCTLVITPDAVHLLTENIEAQRLWDEQLHASQDIVIHPYPWHTPAMKQTLLSQIAQGQTVLNEEDLAQEIFQARTVLTSAEVANLREICQTTAHTLESVCHTLEKGMSEYQLVGRLSQAFWDNNLEPITILVGFDQRALSYRHPVPNGAILENYALIGVCTRRNGLIASVSRMVSLTRDPVMMERQQVSAYVDAVTCLSTVAGANLQDIFQKTKDAYAQKGYAGEWTFHHQGGLTGFAARECKATDDANCLVRNNQVYAFNPSVQGAKSENTILVTPNGPENLTHTGNYPYIKVELDGKTYLSEDILVLDQLS